MDFFNYGMGRYVFNVIKFSIIIFLIVLRINIT